MTRLVLVIVMGSSGLGLGGCSKPEPSAPVQDAGPAVVAPELEQVDEYVDPLEAARADARAQAKADASWREGFDNRAPDADAGPVDPSVAADADAEPQPAPTAVVEDQAKAPILADPTTFNEPLPTIGGSAPPTPGAKHHAPDEQPPAKR